jgi:solute carrier family 30 (zinc transporter), member 9
MSSSVSVSIGTNTAIAAAKAIGWFVTGSPTLFAETVHSIADVANQILLKIGEVRARRGPDALHPFGRGQEKFFWALVSAVSVFFIGCGLNLYHGVYAFVSRAPVAPFTPLVLGLLLFALALESYTFVIALREIGGWRNVARNRNNTTVLAVLLEDAVALLGILLTLLVAGVSFVFGPRPLFDALVAIAVGVLLGVMALFLAALNRRLLIDASDPVLERAVRSFLSTAGVDAELRSIIVDDGHDVLFVHIRPGTSVPTPAESQALGEALKAHAREHVGKTLDEVYWRFPAGGASR